MWSLSSLPHYLCSLSVVKLSLEKYGMVHFILHTTPEMSHSYDKESMAKKTGSVSFSWEKDKERESNRSTTTSESKSTELSVEEINQRKALDRVLPKQLKSKPLHHKKAAALAEKVKGRKPLKASSRESLSADEIVFPSASYQKAEKNKQIKKSAEEPSLIGPSLILDYDTCAETLEMKGLQVPRLPYSRMPIITNNNSNNDHLFVNNLPFWWSPDAWDFTDDELVMNSSVIIDVIENRLNLVPMPDVEIILDPVQEVSILQKRDAQCFTKEIIFGNSVRSMVNLNELSLSELRERSERNFRKKTFPSNLKNENILESLSIREPHRRILYSRDDCSRTFVEDFKPTKRGRYSKEPVSR